MNNIEYYFGCYSIDEGKVPVPENLKAKDNRADPVAKAAVWSANDVIDNAKLTDSSEVSVIVVNREGCESHVKRISDGLSKRTARQGFFARGGPQTLATYTALALGCHGPAYTLVGEQSSIDIALNSAFYISAAQKVSVILTVVVRKDGGGFDAISVLIKTGSFEIDLDDFDKIYHRLMAIYPQESDK